MLRMPRLARCARPVVRRSSDCASDPVAGSSRDVARLRISDRTRARHLPAGGPPDPGSWRLAAWTPDESARGGHVR